MLACFSWRLHGLRSSSPEVEQTVEKAITYFEDYFSRPPLEILASALIYTEAPPEISRTIFSSYNEFLAILDDETARTELQTIPRESADKSRVFQQVRQLSHEYRDALLNWLHMPGSPLYVLVKEYALF